MNKQQALAEYEKVQGPAWAKYKKKIAPVVNTVGSLIPIEMGLSLANSGESCGDSESQQESPAIDDSRHDLIGNRDVAVLTLKNELS